MFRLQAYTTPLRYLNILYYNKNVLGTEIQTSQFLKLPFILKPKYQGGKTQIHIFLLKLNVSNKAKFYKSDMDIWDRLYQY